MFGAKKDSIIINISLVHSTTSTTSLNKKDKEKVSPSKINVNLKDEKVLGEATTTIVNKTNYEKYSTPFQKFIFYFWYRLNTLYKVITGLILLSIISLFFVEFKKHHWKHILYGFISVAIIISALYFNQSLF